jgi:hypothetical protein
VLLGQLDQLDEALVRRVRHHGHPEAECHVHSIHDRDSDVTRVSSQLAAAPDR